MNKVFMSILIIALCVLASRSQNVSEMPTITVSGTGEVRVVPNEAIFNLKVEKLNKDLKLAQQQNDEIVAQLIDLTKRFGVPAQNVKTDIYEYEEKHTWVGRDDEKRVFLGCEASKDVTIRLTDMTRFEDLFREIVKAGVSRVRDVDLRTTEIRKYKAQARAMAMRAAKEKASAMAGEVGQTIGKAVMIREGVFSGSSHSNFSANSNITTTAAGQSYSASYSTAEGATFAPGTISVKADVTVSFLLN